MQAQIDKRKLTNKEILDMYQELLPLHFPVDELKPIDLIQDLLSKNLYSGYGFFEEDEMMSYAFFVHSEKGTCALLDFYAVLPANRGKGLGSTYLSLLKDAYSDMDGIIGEIEHIDWAKNEEEKTQRIRRADFYKRNGWMTTDIHCHCFHVDYSIIYLPIQRRMDAPEISKELDALYQIIFKKSAIWSIDPNYSKRLK